MKLLTAILCALALSYEAPVDVGFCIKYEVEVMLNDGKKVRGFVFTGGWEKKLTFSGKEFLEYHDGNGRRDTLEVFTNIRQLKFPVYHESQPCAIRFDAATKNDVRKVSRQTISDVKVINHFKCHSCDDKDYHSNGLQLIIEELSEKEIAMLQQPPVATISFTHEIQFYTQIYWIVSYSPVHTQAELEKIKQEYLTVTNKLIEDNKPYTDHYKKMKSTLRDKGVVVFQVDTAL